MFNAKTIHPITTLRNLFRKKCTIIRAMFCFLPAYVSSRLTSFWADPSRPSCHLYICDRRIRGGGLVPTSFPAFPIPKQKRKSKQQNCRSISGTNQNRTTSSATLTQSRRHGKRAKRVGSWDLGADAPKRSSTCGGGDGDDDDGEARPKRRRDARLRRPRARLPRRGRRDGPPCRRRAPRQPLHQGSGARVWCGPAPARARVCNAVPCLRGGLER